MTNSESVDRPPIAVVGVSCLFPGSVDTTGFWSDILAKTDRITDVPPTHWLIEDHYDPDLSAKDKTYGRRGGFLDPVDLDVMGFGIPPTMVDSTDTAQLLALIVAQSVLDDATKGQFNELDRSMASVILGVTSGQELLGAMASRMNRPLWLQGMRRAGVPEDVAQAACEQISDLHPGWTEATFPGLLGNVVAGRIANRLDLGGTNCVTDAACASSFSALSMGVNELQLGDSDLVIAGGVDTMNDIFMFMCFSKTPALSQNEDIRPFSDSADGTMLGEGIGMVALKRLDDAERDGNKIYCVINGVGSSSDGRSKSVYAPVSEGQANALTRAYAKTGYGPETVELIEAHGTGTVAGDAAEFGGLEIAFNKSGRSDRQWCALGSVKSQIGHTKAAAGAAGLIKVIMALHHKILPPSAKIDKPNPNLDLEASPFYLNTKARPWVRGSDHERRGSVSSFGFGGSNFHVALSEYTGGAARASRLRTSDCELIILGGADGAELAEQARSLAKTCQDRDQLLWLAQSSQANYSPASQARLAVVVDSPKDLAAKLVDAAERLEKDPTKAFSTPSGVSFGTGDADGEIAFLFPGQGSQYLFMGGDLASNYSEALAPWDVAADQDWATEKLHDIVFPITSFEPDAEQAQSAALTATDWAQPAIGATSLGLLRLLRSVGLDSSYLGGHSYGEITALHAAGVMSETDMLNVSRRRGELMAAAATTSGSMTAVAKNIDELRSLVAESGAQVVVANHNTPTQVVLSGPTDQIEKVEEFLAGREITAKRLPVATAFHSPVVSGASELFTEYLHTLDLAAPTASVFANSTAEPYPTDSDLIKNQLGSQLANPVRFVEMIENMYSSGVRTFVEVGPSSILTGLVKKILKGRDHTCVPLDKKNKSAIRSFQAGLGQLVALGADMDLSALWNEYEDLVDPSSIEAPKMTLPIGGANSGVPYPPADLNDLAKPNPSTDTYSQPAAAPARLAPTPAPLPTSETPAPIAAGPNPVKSEIRMTNPTSTDAVSPGVLEAYAAVQAQTAAAHADYMASMAQVHASFLESAQQSIAILGQLAGASAPANPVHVSETATPPVAPQPVTSSHDVTGPPTLSVQTLTPILLQVVSDKTGYPTDMLTKEMELEADLGIDSIKRVEILAAMQTQVPELPEVDTTIMAELTTLGQIVDYMATTTNNVPVSETATPPVAPQPVTSSHDVTGPPTLSVQTLTPILLQVVSDKTGYPTDMLTKEMELEADLGIDSIKRVEILAAMQTQVPELPEVDTTIMAELTTLGQIVDYMATTTNPVHVSETATPPVAPQPVTSSHDVTGSAAPLGRYVLETVTSPGNGEQIAGLSDGKIAVTNDESGVGPVLVSLLTADGLDAELVDTVPANGVSGVVFLGGLRPTDTVSDAIAVNREAFGAARTMAAHNGSNRLFVTVSDLGGSFGLTGPDPANAWTAGLSGLAKTADIEWQDTTVRSIDIERGGRDAEAIARSIANELLGGGSEIEVGLLADGTRLTLNSNLVEVETGEMPIGKDDVIVVSGGGRGVTAATMIALARATGSTFVLLGRSELSEEDEFTKSAATDADLKAALMQASRFAGENVTPKDLASRASRIMANREIAATLDAIAKAGGRAKYLSVDITNESDVKSALNQVRSDYGSITGLVHGAGVLADKLIADKTDDQFDSVFNTKVNGLRILLESTNADSLKLLCLFSSVAARTGNNGQADYAMANEVLNKVAAAEKARRGPSCVVKSLGWGPWAGGMVSPSLKAHFESMGVTLIPLEEGAEMLVAEIASPQIDQVELVLGAGVLPEPA